MGLLSFLAKVFLALGVVNWAFAVPNVKYLITFGVSYSQTGFDVSGQKPSASNPLVKEYNASLTYSFNFSYGGATIDANLYANGTTQIKYQPTVRSFVEQVQQFSSSIASKDSVTWEIMDSYFSQFEILFKAGAKNFTLLNTTYLLGVIPINKSPRMLSQSKSAQETEAAVIDQFNKLLVDRPVDFIASHKGVTEDLAKYGNKDATCYDSYEKPCLWFNYYHAGTAIHRLIVEAMIGAWKEPFFKVGNQIYRMHKSI
ncbi:carbohydrate esterase family 16 protein [Zopfia rhizophila CBS 207.26]|uniref:Carbohydrate esterase family 16 protein n=1 Tax=Zopfia rhizophila CBS 207.26 TaxID=1314779 RepID=A0A6A6D7X6_9PEZI|nr:carbohydrate esterase family 16 protein [Zopfia rhizophila CBS 207.26]